MIEFRHGICIVIKSIFGNGTLEAVLRVSEGVRAKEYVYPLDPMGAFNHDAAIKILNFFMDKERPIWAKHSWRLHACGDADIGWDYILVYDSAPPQESA